MTQQLHRPAPRDTGRPEAPRSPRPPRRRARRGLLAALAVGAAAGVAGAIVLTDAMTGEDGTSPPAELQPQPQERTIDRTISEREVAPPVESVPVMAGSSSRRPAYVIIQDEIDRALAEREQGAGLGG